MKTAPRRLYFYLAAILLLVFALSLHVGAVRISYRQLALILFHPSSSQSSEAFSVIYFLRLPRLLAVCLVGMGLGLAGAVMQGLLRNPLADPGLLGVSSGSSLAVLLVWLLAGQFAGWIFWQILLPVTALLGSLAVLVFLYLCDKWSLQKDIAGLVLIGIACNALFSSLIALLLYLGPPQFLEDAVLWGFGGVPNVGWELLGSSGVLFLIGAAVLLKQASALNVLALGEEDAVQLGLELNRFKIRCILGVALIVAASVALSGAIAFVGLIVPHIMRKILGANHRHLLPCSALAGGIFLLSADMLCQNISHTEVLPLGIVTALTGALFFIWLLFCYRRAYARA